MMHRIDIRSDGFKRAPHAALSAAIRHGPIVQARLPIVGNVKLATTHAAVHDVLKRVEDFAVDARNAGHRNALGFPFLPETFKLMADNLLAMDDPRHQRLRRFADAPFRRVEIDKLRKRVEVLAGDTLDEFESTPDASIISVFRDLPIKVISDLLGLTSDARDRLCAQLSGLTGAGSTLAIIRAMFRIGDVVKQIRQEIELARDASRPGLLAELIKAEAGGDTMGEDDLVAMVLVLFVAGHDTTTNLLSSGLYTLLTVPGAWEAARALDSDGWRIAVDELMRFCGPVQFTKPRFAKRDLEFYGVSLKRGEKIMALLAAANLDPLVFDNPLELDLARRPNRHTGWGGGPHICLGLHLAKMEAEIVLSQIVARWPDLSISGETEWSKRLGVRGLRVLPLARD